jgi:tetratricopeptide (TPR) repeat protein
MRTQHGLLQTTDTPLLSRALAHLRRGELDAAERILLRAVSQRAADADALQLLGLVRFEQGDLVDAERLYKQSLDANPRQPNVRRNLGLLLRQVGRLDEAISELRDAISLKPNYVEALLDLGLALSARGEPAQAESTFRQALRVQPNFLAAKQGLAAVLNDAGRPSEAEQVLKGALAQGARDPGQAGAIEHNLGVSLKMQERYAEALRAFDAAKAKLPNVSSIDSGRAGALQGLGRYDEAVESYRQALAKNPLDIESHLDLNRLLYRLGRDDEFLLSLREAIELHPDAGALYLTAGTLLFRKEDFGQAREAYERAVALLPDDAAAHDGLGMTLARIGEFSESLRVHETAVKLSVADSMIWRNYAETLLRAGNPDTAREAAVRALQLNSLNQGAIAIWGLAMRGLGDEHERAINDCDKFVRIYDIDPPAEYADAESFNAALNAELDNLHRDRRENIDQTLRNGVQTLGNLFGKGHRLVECLRKQIDGAIADYIAQLEEDPNHPLLGRKRNGFEYSASWSARLFNCGFHTNHIHPKGWISSAYYVALPDAVNDIGQKQGWIKFGEPSFECGLGNAVRRAVRPRIGTLVLFPSYMWHGTVPFVSRHSRTTIAFDVVPR